MVAFLAFYYAIRFLYFYAMTEEQQEYFEYLVQMFDLKTKAVPLAFLLGSYIAIIVKRWWCQFEWVAWPDDLLSNVCVLLPGSEEETRLKRHTIARYLCLTATLAWREISSKIRLRFPTLNHVVSSGLMTEHELELYLNTKLDNFRLCCHRLFCYDWVCVPLVYTQIAAVATYGYLTFCLIGRQFLNPQKNIKGYEVDYYVPIVTIVEFFFYVGWFKIGQDLMRPFGKDDDDLELSYILDRHIETSFSLVNEVADQNPPLVKDKFWEALNQPLQSAGEANGVGGKNTPLSIPVPHTKLSAKFKDNKPILHVRAKLKNPDDGEILDLNAITLSETARNQSASSGRSRFSSGFRSSRYRVTTALMNHAKMLGIVHKFVGEDSKHDGKNVRKF